MTVPYSNKVATSSFSCFFRLLFRWRGSIYKLLWKEFAVFALLFYLLGFTYRFCFNKTFKRGFETVAVYCQEFVDLIPLAFVLGFYVSIVVNRFWEQFNTIPYPTRMALFVSTLITGRDERGRLMRRTIMRYLCLSHLMTMAAISPPVKKRFPDYQHMTDAGFMLTNEQRIIENMSTASNKYFVPLIWSASLVLRARKEGRIKDDFAVKTLIDEINDYRGMCGRLFAYDYVTVPIVYTQVVTIAVYMFFMSCLMGRQFLENEKHGDLYFPLFTFLQFFFYMGWLKVAESLVNPFGEDDDDFDINGMIDKNLPMSYLIVDEMHNEHPELIRDQYWDSFNKDIQVPYNEASHKFQTPEFIGSAANINIPPAKKQFLPSVASNMDAMMGSQTSVLPGLDTEANVLTRKHKKLGRSTSRLSNLLKASFSRQSSRLEVTKEQLEEGVPLQNVPSKPDEEKSTSSKKLFSSDLMFRISIDDDSNPTTPQASPSTNKLVSSTIQPMTPPIKSAILTDPFISQPPTTPLNTSFPFSSTLKASDQIEVFYDGKDGSNPQTPSQPQQPSALVPSSQPLPNIPSSLLPTGQPPTPLVIPQSSSTPPTSQPLSTPPTSQPLTISSTPSTQPSQPPMHPSSKQAPSTSLRTLEPVIETAESPEAFMGAVMHKLKEIRDNK